MALKEKKTERDSRPNSPHIPLFRASVASAPGTFLSAAWLATPNENDEGDLRCYPSGSNNMNINLRSSLSTINSEGVKEKDVSPERSSTNNNINTDNINDNKKETDKTETTTIKCTTTDQASSTYYDSSVKSWPIKKRETSEQTNDVTISQWRSLENLSRALLLAAFVSFSIGVGLTTAGFATSGLSVSVRVSLQITGPVMLAGAIVASSLGFLLGKLWKGEWKQRQIEMESAVKTKLEKLAKEILYAQQEQFQQQQREHFTYEYPQRSQRWLSRLSPSCGKIVEGVLSEVETSLNSKNFTSKADVRSSRVADNFRSYKTHIHTPHKSFKTHSISTETTTANSRRSSSRLNSLAEISWRGRDSISSVLLKQEIENQLQGIQNSPNQLPVYDLPGIQISRIETIDLDRASAGSSGSSTKRFIIVHGDLTSSQFSFTSEYSLMSSNARSRSSNEASLLEFSPRESEWDADVSLCSRDSQTSIAYSRSSRGSGREVGRLYYHHYPQQQPQQQQQLLLIPPSSDKYSGKFSNISSPRRHSSPVSSQNRKNIGECKIESGRFSDRYFDRIHGRPLEDNNTDSESSLSSRLPYNPPYSSCSPLLLKINYNNYYNNMANTVATSNSQDNNVSEIKAELSTQQTHQHHKQLLQQQSQQRIFNERMRPWFRKRSDQSIISMKINEHDDDDDDENDVTKNVKKPEIVMSVEDNLTTMETNSIEKEKKVENGCLELGGNDDSNVNEKQRITTSVGSNSTIDPALSEGKQQQQQRNDLQQQPQQQPVQHKRRKKSSSSSPPQNTLPHQNGEQVSSQIHVGDFQKNGDDENDIAAATTSCQLDSTSLAQYASCPSNKTAINNDASITIINDNNTNNNNNDEVDISDPNNIDPRWRHFFGGSCSMALVASSTVASVLERRRTSLKRNNTDDSEVERRVARLLKEIELSATDSLDEQQTAPVHLSKQMEPERDQNITFAQKHFGRKHKRRHCRPLVNVPVASKSVGTESTEKCPDPNISHEQDPDNPDLESTAYRTKQRRNSYAATGIIRKQAIASSSSSSQPTSQLISSSSLSSRTNRSAEIQTIAFDSESTFSIDWKRPPTKKMSFAKRDLGACEQETEALVSEVRVQDDYGSFRDNVAYSCSTTGNEPNSERLAHHPSSSRQSVISGITDPDINIAPAASSLSRNANKLKLIAKTLPHVLVAECSKLVGSRKDGSVEKGQK